MTEPHKNRHETSRGLQENTELLRRISSALVGLLADEAVTVYSAGTDEPSDRGIEDMERMRLARDDITARAQKLQAELTGTRK